MPADDTILHEEDAPPVKDADDAGIAPAPLADGDQERQEPADTPPEAEAAPDGGASGEGAVDEDVEPPADARAAGEAVAGANAGSENAGANAHPGGEQVREKDDTRGKREGMGTATEEPGPADLLRNSGVIGISSRTDGNQNVTVNTVFQTSFSEGDERIRPLRELTDPFRAQPVASCQFDPSELDSRWRELVQERLILISCVERSIAQAAAHELVSTSGVPHERIRQLSFGRMAKKDEALTVRSVVEAPHDGDAETLLVVYAVGDNAQLFRDSLLADAALWSAAELRALLAEKRLLVVVAAEPQHCSVPDPADLPFAFWPVSCLEPLLRRAFPSTHHELGSAIREQRDAGRWSRDDREFCREVRTAITRNQLQALVDAGGPPRRAAHELPLGSDRPLHAAALYVAAYLPGLDLDEFERVVATLLGDETATVTVAALPMGTGTAATAEVQKDVRLADLWSESIDRVMRECRLAVTREPGEGTTVVFSEPGAGEQVRRAFEDEQPFFLRARLRAMHLAGLLFHPSDTIASTVQALTVQMVAAHPSGYGTGWLLAQVLAGEAAELGHWSRRMAGLLRALAEEPECRPLIDAVLDHFIDNGHAEVALLLTRGLRFAPAFDAFRWMRQLIDRGDESVRWATYRLLKRELMSMDLQVYPTLRVVSAWLPPAGRPPERFSPSHRLGLRLLLEYALERAQRMCDDDYGAWPSRYPLFAITDHEALGTDIPMLARWLMHPGLESVLDGKAARNEGTLHQVLALLLAEWTYILFGPHGRLAQPAPTGLADDAREADPDLIHAALLREIVAATDDAERRTLRRALLDDWEVLKAVLADTRAAASHADRHTRNVLLWKRSLVSALSLRFRALVQRPATGSSHAIRA